MVIGRAATHRRAVEAVALVVAAVGLTIVFSLIGAALTHRAAGSESRLMHHLDGGPSAIATVISKALSVLGSQGVLVPVVLAVCGLLALRRAGRAAVAVAVSAAGGIALSNVVKLIVDRPRPALVHLVHVSSSSFPSGHATQAAAIFPALALAAATAGTPRFAAYLIAVIATIGVGMSRVLLGVHYPSDVIAGWLLGGTWFALTYLVLINRWVGRGTRSAPAAGPES